MKRILACAVLGLAVVSARPAVAQAPAGGALPQRPDGRPMTLEDLEAAARRDPGDHRVLVILGLAYWDRQDFPRALETFQRAVRIAPQSAEAQNWLGVALSEKGDLPGAIAAFRKAVALDAAYGRAWSNLGSALAQSSDYGEAIAVFEKALALEPNSVGAHLNLGMALRESGDLERALVHLRRVVEADPGNAAVQYELGQTLRQSGDLEAAVAAFERAIEIDPELREGYYALGVALKQQSAASRHARAPEPGPAEDLYSKARAAAERGDFSEARRQAAEAVRLDGRHAEARNLLGFVLGQQGELAAALEQLQQAVRLAPDDADAHYNYGVALYYSGDKAKAVAELRDSIRLDPAAGATYAFLGSALLEAGDPGAARVYLQRAIALLPPTPAVYFDLGITYLRGGDLDRGLGQFEAGLNAPTPARPEPDWTTAIASLRSAIASDAGRADAHNMLGLLLGRQGADAAEVAAAFREAVRLRPDFAEAHNNLGLVLIQGGEDEAGIEALREAVRLRPDYAEALTNLGAALTPTDAAEGVRHLEKAVGLAPTSVKAQFNLAVAYGAEGGSGLEKEIAQLRKVNALAPGFARSRVALGKALLREGQVPEAVAELEEAVKLAPESGEAHYQLGLALARAGRRGDATAALEKGRALVAADDRSQNAQLDLAQGRAALDEGELALAASRFQRAIKLQPDWPEAHRQLGIALQKQGDTDGAVAAYRRTLELNPADVAAKRSLERLTAAAAVDDSARILELEGYIRDGRFDEVEPLLADYVAQRPASSWGWYALGYSYFAQQKIGDAIKALAKSLELDVSNAEAHKILGRTLMIIGRFDAAQMEFELGIRYKPASAEMHYNLAKLFSIQDNWEPARKAFEAAIRLDPDYVEAIDGLGFALEALGDDDGAVARYQEAVALNEERQGGFAGGHLNLSALYNRTGDAALALEHARAAIAIDPGSDRAWFQRGRAEERLGNLDNAVTAFNQAIAANPRASSYYYVLAGVYRRLGQEEASRQALAEFKRLEQESAELEKMRRQLDAANPPGRKRE
jgi:tetratricopeptide (TPR) repeat protein